MRINPSPPSPSKLTRAALRKMEGGEALLAPALKNPEPKKGRKMCRTILIDHTGGAPPLFGETADEIKRLVEERVALVDVVINGDDRRGGCFVVREEGERVFLELLDMVSPFARLQHIDVNSVVEQIVQALF